MSQYDLIVIGAGPGGYVGAIRAAQLGLNVACIDEHDAPGGVCLRVGCIPSKALLESSELFAQAAGGLAEHGLRTGPVELDLPAMLARKDRIVATLTRGVASLLKKNKVARFVGSAGLTGGGAVRVRGADGETELAAKNVLIATGSQPTELPGLPFDGQRIVTSSEALNFPAVPRRLVVIGAGAIGLELGSVWRRLGAEVTVLEALDRILPGADAELAAAAAKLLARQGLEFRLGARVAGATVRDDGVAVQLADGEPIECDRVLVAVGRSPRTSGLGLEAAGVAADAKGRIRVDANFATTAAGVFAVGDVIGGAMLAHKASEEATACVEKIAGAGDGRVAYDAIPAVVYTHPELAGVGRTEEQLAEAGVAFAKGVCPFRANGRARTLGQVDGMVKVLADAGDGRLLGVHILGPRAGDLIAEAAVAIAGGATADDLARAPHAHPTLAEAVKEAALAAAGRAIHL